MSPTVAKGQPPARAASATLTGSPPLSGGWGCPRTPNGCLVCPTAHSPCRDTPAGTRQEPLSGKVRCLPRTRWARAARPIPAVARFRMADGIPFPSAGDSFARPPRAYHRERRAMGQRDAGARTGRRAATTPDSLLAGKHALIMRRRFLHGATSGQGHGGARHPTIHGFSGWWFR